MRNKKAQVFAVYLAVLTGFMIFLVVMMYVAQSKQVSASLVSPVKMLELQDKKELFELQEKELILKSAKVEVSNWGKNKDKIKENFCNYFVSFGRASFRSFLFEDLIIDEKEIPIQALDSQQEYKDFCNNNYIFSFSNENLIVERKELGKSFVLKAEKSKKERNFGVSVNYLFSGKQEITLEEVNKFTFDPEKEIISPILQAWILSGNNDKYLNYQYEGGRWTSLATFRQGEKEDFEKGLDRILESVFSRANPYWKVKIFDLSGKLVYEKEFDYKIREDSSQVSAISSEIKDKMKQGIEKV